MELFFRKIGQGPPLIILHGLYGSSDNWISVARLLEKHFEIFLIDQRNHGKSPHSEEFNYELLSSDIFDFFAKHNIVNANLLGHSMGGKTAMHFAKNYPELLKSLILIDIAPKNYTHNISQELITHHKIIETLLLLDLSQLKSREQADEELAKDIESLKLRSFLLKNLHRNNTGKFEWLLNLDSISLNFKNIADGFPIEQWQNVEVSGFPVLFVKGGKSRYIMKEDEVIINKIFPGSEIFEIPETGHWLHAEKPVELSKKIISFILD
ncbi:MAG: alpha/beta fold hydrolase [Bacteroidia bacterium]|nr:alpha/beta fold hydrolase [Bacteroidia bacterium]